MHERGGAGDLEAVVVVVIMVGVVNRRPLAAAAAALVAVVPAAAAGLVVVRSVGAVYPSPSFAALAWCFLAVVHYVGMVFPCCRSLCRRGVSLAVVCYVGLVPSSPSVGLFDRLGSADGQWGGMREGMGKTNHGFHRGSFSVTHWMGLPIHGSPLMYSSPRFLRRARIRRPFPFGKGRGGCGYILASEVSLGFVFWAHIPQ